MTTDTILRVGKEGASPELIKSVSEALEARELIKIGVLDNCPDDAKTLAETISERSGSQVVQIIGKKIVLYKEGKDDKKKIVLPK